MYHVFTDVAKFRRITPAVMKAVVTRLESASTDNLPSLERGLGCKLQPRGIMFNDRSRLRMCPSSEVSYDWAHIFLVNGIWNACAGFMLHHLKHKVLKVAQVAEYVGSFHWPRSMSFSI